MVCFFQIGTNNGNDNFRDLVIKNNPDLIILVEPCSILIEQIKKYYNNIQNVHIYNNAIYYRNDEIVDLYVSTDKDIITCHGHLSILPMNDWGEKKDMPKISAKSITFDEICRIHNITEIELLQIDTEGFDSEIIDMIDFSKYKINNIIYEKWGFSEEAFTKHNNQIAHKLGLNGIHSLYTKYLTLFYFLGFIATYFMYFFFI